MPETFSLLDLANLGGWVAFALAAAALVFFLVKQQKAAPPAPAPAPAPQPSDLEPRLIRLELQAQHRERDCQALQEDGKAQREILSAVQADVQGVLSTLTYLKEEVQRGRGGLDGS